MSTNETSPAPALCKHWARGKTCLYHARGVCRFQHPEDYTIPEQASNKARVRAANGRLNKVNGNRVAKFRRFVHEQMGDMRGERVLDVAGGKGELAYQLANITRVAEVHVIDPRPLQLDRFKRWRAKGFYHKSAAVHLDIASARTDPECPVGHLPILFSPELWEGDELDAAHAEREQAFARNLATAQRWPRHAEAHRAAARSRKCKDGHACKHLDPRADYSDEDEPGQDSFPTCKLRHEEFSQEVEGSKPTLEAAARVVREATLVLGIHPDQAVDAIVDAAVHLDVPFFVAPCCVYAPEFPNRRFNGEPVTTYAELLDYLQAKSPDIQRVVLPFEGKNVCLYRTSKMSASVSNMP
eukprot:CAMPEP_0114261876 /NCGR_PEP_ID=MMETSP0058-20121206/21420_1 /TAXON_ID=36894 /ORGANISM="Pyramimonas parkeae, CCMP726" /LENGTH=354 /DNA_ID=CAMNT_0001377539 /DNA_START=162 /DNA_END=1223 /DNA_ORIENTATION=+